MLTSMRCVHHFNNQFPQSVLKGRSPFDAPKDWQRRRPDLFRKQVCNHAGCDNGRDTEHTQAMLSLHEPIAPTAPVELAGTPAQGDALGSLSIVVSMHEEIDNIHPLHEELAATLTGLGRPDEPIFVDDASTDGSCRAFESFALRDSHLCIATFRHDYGQTAAMKAGINDAATDVTVTIVGERRNTPADDAPVFVDLKEGADPLDGWRKNRKDAVLSRKPPFCLANRQISLTPGFPRREVETQHRPRVARQTTSEIGRGFKVLLDLMTRKYVLDYAKHPMRLFGGLGLPAMVASLPFPAAKVRMKTCKDFDMTGNLFPLGRVVSRFAGIPLLGLGIADEALAWFLCGQNQPRSQSMRRLSNFAPGAVSAVKVGGDD